MPAVTPRNPRRWVQVRPPDLAAVMMARAMAEMFRDEPDGPLPGPLAALLWQMELWRKEQGKQAADKECRHQQRTWASGTNIW